MRPHPQRQLFWLKRFDEIIVCTHLEPDALIDDIAFCRQEHDRNLSTFAAYGFADVVSVRIGQHHVEDEKIGALGAQHGQALGSVGGAAVLVAVALGDLPDENLKALIVIDQHYLRHRSPLHAARPAARR